jgi:hypothetical protein
MTVYLWNTVEYNEKNIKLNNIKTLEGLCK